MDEINIFEIPVYRMSEENFLARLQKTEESERKKNNKNFGEQNEEFHRQYWERTYQGKRQWLYNQIIGYITIKMSFQDIIFYLNKPSRNLHAQYLSDTKVYLGDGFMIGQHFHIESNWTNADISEEIKSWINLIIKEEEQFFKGKYIDFSLFDLYIDNFDFLTLQKKLRISGSYK